MMLEQLDIEVAKTLTAGAGSTGVLGLFGWLWLKSEFKGLRERIDGLRDRVTKLEAAK